MPGKLHTSAHPLSLQTPSSLLLSVLRSGESPSLPPHQHSELLPFSLGLREADKTPGWWPPVLPPARTLLSSTGFSIRT